MNEQLLKAVENGEDTEVRRLLTSGAEIAFRGKNSATALHIACINGRTSTVEVLLSKLRGTSEKRSLVGARDRWHWTPLHDAAKGNYVDIMKLLVAEGAEIEAVTKDQYSPLHVAAGYGSVEAIRFLVEKGADLESRNKDNNTPLHVAVGARHKNAIRVLFQKGANIEAKGKDLQTPLHIAAQEEDCEPVIAKHLLELGADIEARNESGQTPLHIACMSGSEGGGIRTAALLIAEGADIQAQCEVGYTPLHASVYRMGPDMCRFLIGKGADPTAEDEDGRTPYQCTRPFLDSTKRKLLKEAEYDWGLNH